MTAPGAACAESLENLPTGGPAASVQKRASTAAPSQDEGDKVTTLMLKNLPRKYTPLVLLPEVEATIGKGFVDFVYLPWDSAAGTNMGYAFLNFVTPEAAQQAWSAMEGMSWRLVRSIRQVKIVPAFVQGLAQNLMHCAYKFPPDADNEHCPLVWRNGKLIDFKMAVRLYARKSNAQKKAKKLQQQQAEASPQPGQTQPRQQQTRKTDAAAASSSSQSPAHPQHPQQLQQMQHQHQQQVQPQLTRLAMEQVMENSGSWQGISESRPAGSVGQFMQQAMGNSPTLGADLNAIVADSFRASEAHAHFALQPSPSSTSQSPIAAPPGLHDDADEFPPQRQGLEPQFSLLSKHRWTSNASAGSTEAPSNCGASPMSRAMYMSNGSTATDAPSLMNANRLVSRSCYNSATSEGGFVGTPAHLQQSTFPVHQQPQGSTPMNSDHAVLSEDAEANSIKQTHRYRMASADVHEKLLQLLGNRA